MKLPSTLLARTNVVLGLSAAAIAATSIVALAMFVIRPIQDRSADDEAGLMVLSAKTWVELLPEARLYFALEMLQEHDLTILAEPRELLVVDPGNAYYELLADKLSQRLGESVRLMESDGLVWANVPVGGYVLQIGISPERRAAEPLYVIISVVLFGTVIVFAASAHIVRRVAGPLSDAARAVESFRGAESFAALPEEGPAELVTLAASFNAMARDVSELISNRTTLLAGISHDLRTPLTRMRFAVELLPDDVASDMRERLERNLTAMDELISNALRFARGTGEAAQALDFKEYLQTVVTSIDDDLAIEWRADLPGQVDLAPEAFQRVITNLVVNARQHGGGAEIVVDTRNNALVVHVVDHGPGIPEQDREKVFQPFYRLDGSRSPATGGSGLGLAIVRQLCQAHGWQISLNGATGAGTDAEVSVALSQARRVSSPGGAGDSDDSVRV